MKKEIKWLRLPKTVNEKARTIPEAEADLLRGQGISGFRVALDCHSDDTCIA